MKTAISIPDEVFRSAEKLAHRLGVSRSSLYVDALKSYLEKHDDSRVTEKLDQVYGKAEAKLDDALASMQARSLPKEKW